MAEVGIIYETSLLALSLVSIIFGGSWYTCVLPTLANRIWDQRTIWFYATHLWPFWFRVPPWAIHSPQQLSRRHQDLGHHGRAAHQSAGKWQVNLAMVHSTAPSLTSSSAVPSIGRSSVRSYSSILDSPSNLTWNTASQVKSQTLSPSCPVMKHRLIFELTWDGSSWLNYTHSCRVQMVTSGADFEVTVLINGAYGILLFLDRWLFYFRRSVIC